MLETQEAAFWNSVDRFLDKLAEGKTMDTKTKAFHELKTLPEFWHLVAAGVKTYEVRQNDRGYQAGDTLRLFCGVGPDFRDRPFVDRRVTHVLSHDDFAPVPEGFAILSIAALSKGEGPAVEWNKTPNEDGGFSAFLNGSFVGSTNIAADGTWSWGRAAGVWGRWASGPASTEAEARAVTEG